jgi:hypothetical protein
MEERTRDVKEMTSNDANDVVKVGGERRSEVVTVDGESRNEVVTVDGESSNDVVTVDAEGRNDVVRVDGDGVVTVRGESNGVEIDAKAGRIWTAEELGLARDAHQTLILYHHHLAIYTHAKDALERARLNATEAERRFASVAQLHYQSSNSAPA